MDVQLDRLCMSSMNWDSVRCCVSVVSAMRSEYERVWPMMSARMRDGKIGVDEEAV